MHTKKIIIILSCTLLVLLLFSGILIITNQINIGEKEESTSIEPDEMTAEYLMSEYPETLITNGALATLSSIGEIKPSSEEGYYEIVLEGKEAFPDEKEADGYYLADVNTSLPVVLDSETQIVYNDNNNFIILSLEDFIIKHNEDLAAIASAEEISSIDKSTLSEDEIMELESQKIAAVEKYYNVYTTGTQTLLITPFVYTSEKE